MNDLDQETRLKLLGLWPRWRLKPAYLPHTGAAAAKPTTESATEHPIPVAARTAEVDAGAKMPQAVAPVSETPVSAADRRTQIMRMDWDELTQTICRCQECGLAQSRSQAVPGVGDRKAEWLVVGEAPGADEDAQGEPFVGQAGKLLDNMLAAIGLKRGAGVYIANVLKCRPPNNRNPQDIEITACEPYLARQIELIRPRIILAVGKFAAQWLLASDQPVGALRGKIHHFNEIPVIVTYHPAYLLRSPTEKARAWEDLCLAQDALKQSAPSLREDD